jgi:hypothetical protein
MKGLERKIEHYSHDSREFECFWGDGYRSEVAKSILAYHDIDFFTEDRGYWNDDIHKVKHLIIGETVRFDENGDHWVRRIK